MKVKEISTKKIFEKNIKKLGKNLRKNLKRVSKKSRGENLHDYRVSYRRYMAGMKALEELFEVDLKLKDENFQVRKIFKKSGELRDLILFKERISIEEIDSLKAIETELKNKIKNIKSEVKEMIDKKSCISLKKSISRREKIIKNLMSFKGKKEEEFNEKINMMINKSFSDVISKRRELKAEVDFEKIHKMRVAFKEFRYKMEFLRSYIDVPATVFNRMGQYQDLMGAILDAGNLSIYLEVFEEAKEFREEIERESEAFEEIFLTEIEVLFEFWKGK